MCVLPDEFKRTKLENLTLKTFKKMTEQFNPQRLGLTLQYYSPSDSKEWYDEETDQFYSRGGDPLRHPSEYDEWEDGYTPFGDE